MTIKRRLFISNIFMLLIPFIVSALVTYGVVSIFLSYQSNTMEKIYPRIFGVIERFRKNGDIAELERQMDQLRLGAASGTIDMLVFDGSRVVYPRDSTDIRVDTAPLQDLIKHDVDGSFNVGSAHVLIERAHAYSIVVVDEYPKEHGRPRPTANLIHIVPVIVVIVVLLTNFILTWFVIKRITDALNTLRGGVRQIRDGNLDYRINYSGKDEFSPVCEDFNEMAVRLDSLIARQQRDENSRKELLAGISHDLRTPLTSIRAYVDGLLDGVAQDRDTQLRYLQTVRTKATEIDSIVDKLFLFAKLDIGEFPFYSEKVDIGGEINAMMEAFGAEYEEKGMALTLTENVTDIFVLADPLQLRNAIVNLLENSLRYKDKEYGRIEVSCAEAEEGILLTFSDDGPGVPEEALGKLFDVFYRSDPSRNNPSSGSGLGLAITAKILERLGGSIRAENIPSGGLRIIITLPKYVEDRSEANTDY